MEQFRPKTIPPLAIPERLNAHCEELYELIASLNNILNLYMPAGQEAEHRFAMGELPDEVLEICQRLQNSPRCCVAWRSYFLTI